MEDINTKGVRARSETSILRQIIKTLSVGRARLFRNTVGAAFVGPHVYTADGALIISRPSRVTFGFGPGTSDLIGWRSRIVTDEMVGQRVAVFVALEVKSQTGRATEQQKAFVEVVKAHGGIAGIVRSVSEAQELLK